MNEIAKILELNKQKNNFSSTKWGINQRRKLVETLEKAGANISDSLYDSLLFNIYKLIIHDNKVAYMTIKGESKKINKLFTEYNDIIVEKYDYIVKP